MRCKSYFLIVEENNALCGASLYGGSVIFVNENENKNGEKRENKEFVNEN